MWGTCRKADPVLKQEHKGNRVKGKGDGLDYKKDLRVVLRIKWEAWKITV